MMQIFKTRAGRAPTFTNPAFTNRAAIGAIVSIATLWPGIALAQKAAPDDSGVIIVTAQKRKEDIKNVPLSITVLKGTALEQQKVTDFQDLGRIVPGLSVTNSGSSSLSRLQLRGISSEQGSSTVGIYLEDISLTIPNLFLTGETLPRLFDLDHIEVLRGPQGTLFGASALGGAIRFIPNKPNLDTIEGEVHGDLSSTHLAGTNYLVEGVLNIPIITDKVALRVGIQRSDDTGFVTRYDGNGVAHDNTGDEKTTAVRATLLIKPTESLSIEPALLFQNNYANGTSIFQIANLPQYRQDRLTAEYTRDRLVVPSLSIHYDTGPVQLTSISAYVRRTNDRLNDGNFYDSQYVAYLVDPNVGSTYNTIAALPGPYYNRVTSSQYSQEFRAGSKPIEKTGQRYEWQIGGYYFHQNVLTLDDEYVSGLGSTLTQIFDEDPSTVLGAPLVNDEVGAYHYDYKTREIAVFGQASYMVLPRLKATLGARQSFARASYTVDEFGLFLIGLPAFASGANKEHPFLPKASLTYEASREATFYATAAKGYRLGGHNLPLPSSCQSSFDSLGLSGQTDNYTPDSLWSYEGGTKLRLMNGRLSVNASGFYIDWKNIQQNVSLNSCGYNITVNAGTARSYGGELELNARITKSLSLNFSGSVTDAKIKQAAPGSGAADGQSLLFVPHDNFSIGADYLQPLDDKYSIHAHIDANLTGKSHGTYDTSDPDYVRPGYTVVNLNFGLTRGPIDFALFARNLFDEDKVIQRPFVLGQEQGIRVRPRTLGGSATVKF